MFSKKKLYIRYITLNQKFRISQRFNPPCIKQLGMLIVLMLPATLFGGSQHDSLLTVIRNAGHDSTRLNALLALSNLHWDENAAKQYYRESLQLASNMDSSAVLRVELNEANLLHKRSEFAAALKKAEGVITAGARFQNDITKAEAHHVAAKASYALNRLNEAISHRQSEAALYKAQGDSAAYCQSLVNLGVLFKNAGVYNRALDVLLRALVISEELGDTEQEARTLNNIGNVYKWQENLTAALDAHKRALTLREKTGDINQLADSHNNIGLVLRKMERFEEALSAFRKSLRYRNQGGHRRGASYTFNNLALLHLNMGVTDSAIFYLERSMEIKKELGNARDLAIGHVNLGEVYLKKGDLERSQYHYRSGLEQLPEATYPEVELEAFNGLAELEEARGNFEKAYAYLRQHDLLEDSLEEANNRLAMDEMMASYALYKAENQMSRLEQQQRLQELELQNYELERNSLILLLSAVAIIVLMVLLRYRSVKQFNQQLKTANQELRETLISNEEKETLLKEIHHRVKNNLQIITSLIRLQSASIKDPKIAALFSDSQHRIKTMALVHEELYRTKNFTSVDVGEYLERLTRDLVDTYAIRRNIDFSIKTDVKRLGVNTLIPMGLMVNEIITNALKHAFDGEEGKISIAFCKAQSNEFDLHISDNGSGFPAGVDFENPETLGLELINTLTDQLDGTVRYYNDGGAHYAIHFKSQD